MICEPRRHVIYNSYGIANSYWSSLSPVRKRFCICILHLVKYLRSDWEHYQACVKKAWLIFCISSGLHIRGWAQQLCWFWSPVRVDCCLFSWGSYKRVRSAQNGREGKLVPTVYGCSANQVESLVSSLHHSCVIVAGCRALEHHFSGRLCLCLWWREGHG